LKLITGEYMLDVNGKSIKAGDYVKAANAPGGWFPPGKTYVGIVEECMDAFGTNTLQIRSTDSKGRDKLYIITHMINKIVTPDI
jgi:hypothetical protein